jgi:protein involved in ribonucleotide reduction
MFTSFSELWLQFLLNCDRIVPVAAGGAEQFTADFAQAAVKLAAIP